MFPVAGTSPLSVRGRRWAWNGIRFIRYTHASQCGLIVDSCRPCPRAGDSMAQSLVTSGGALMLYFMAYCILKV